MNMNKLPSEIEHLGLPTLLPHFSSCFPGEPVSVSCLSVFILRFFHLLRCGWVSFLAPNQWCQCTEGNTPQPLGKNCPS